MSDTPRAYHQATILRRLPTWSRQLPSAHVERLFDAPRKEYLDEAGQPCAWYANAGEQRQQALRLAIAQRDASRAAMATALAGLEGITTFCQPRLQQALAIEMPVTVAQYVFQPWESQVYIDPVHIDVPEGVPREFPEITPIANGAAQPQSLLSAALHNFESLAAAGPLSYLQASADDPAELTGLTLDAFIRTCRTLDLGQQYQRHLEGIFQGNNADRVQRTSTQAARDELRVQAHIACQRALLSEAGLSMLLQVCAQDANPSYAGRAVATRRIELFATVIHEVLLIGPQDDDQVNPCIVYTPGDPLHPVREYASVQAYGLALAQTLVQRERLQLFIGYAPQRLQPALAQRLEHALFERIEVEGQASLRPRRERKLDISEHPVGTTLWQTLHASHVSRVMDDARAIAVPTADVDAQARFQRLAYWAGKGLDVLNVAALFVPGLNTLMLAIGGAQVMDEIFEGLHAWEDGNTAEALEHVKSLALNALVVGALGVAAKAFKASGFVDALESVETQGQEKLWSSDLKPYRSNVDLPRFLQPDGQGMYLHEQRHYIRIEGAVYETFADDAGNWHVRHPSDNSAYTPRLRHNGQGAWRLALESPLDWDDTQLLRRLGHRVEGLSEGDLDMALRISETSPGQLRYTHINGTHPPALLADSLLRLRCDNETEALIGNVREGNAAAQQHFAVASLVELPSWPEHLRVRVYDGPEPWGSATLYGNPEFAQVTPLDITRAQLDNGELAEMLIDQLNPADSAALLPPDTPQAGRPQALRTLLADHLQGARAQLFERLYASYQPSESAAAARIGSVFGGLCPLAREALVNHASEQERVQLAATEHPVPLHIAEEARLLQSRQRLDRALLGVYRPALANDDSQRLVAGLRAARPELAGSAPGELLAQLLANRAEAARLIGQQPVRPGFRSPMRLSEGRIGYPLSGRLRGILGLGRESDQLQDLYPAMTREQRSALISLLRQRGNLADQLTALRRERDALDDRLTAWSQAAAQAGERSQRERFRNVMMAAWRQEGGATLRLHDLALPALPTLLARFDHIQSLIISGLDLETLSQPFLESFPGLQHLTVSFNPGINGTTLFNALRSTPRLRALDLSNNNLRVLPEGARQALAGLRSLRRLHLRSNNLSLTPDDVETFAGLHLEALGLQDNNITLTTPMAQRFGDMVHLRGLALDFNPLQLAPHLDHLAQLEELALVHCELQAWPQGLTTLMSQQNYQLRHVDLSVNLITQVPALDEVLATPYAQGARTNRRGVRWHFNYNPLDQETLAQLREHGVAAYQESDDIVEASRVDWNTYASETQRQTWERLFDNGANPALADVLDRLGLGAEARQQPAALAERVWRMVDELAGNTELRARIETLAEHYPATCGDAGTDGFSSLELEMQAYHEMAHADLPGPYLFNWYRRLFRRSQVNALADNISLRRGLRRQALVEARDELPALDPLDNLSDERLLNGLVDDIETRLALRQELHSERFLDFPEPSSQMLYRETAMINDTIVYNVEQAVMALDQDATQRRDWIARQPAWQLYLRRTYASQTQALLEQWAAGADYLGGLHDDAEGRLPPSVVPALTEALGHSPLAEDGTARPLDPNLDEQAMLQAWQRFGAARQRAEDDLLLDLTTSNDVND